MKSLDESVINKEALRCKMKKRILLLFIFFFLIIEVFILWKLFLNKPNEIVSSVNREQALPTEQFIINHLMTEDGMIRTNFANQKDGELFLSESKDRKSTRLNSSHVAISYAVFCLKKKNKTKTNHNTKIKR